MRRISTSASSNTANLANNTTKKHSAKKIIRSSIRYRSRDSQNNQDKHEEHSDVLVLLLSSLVYVQR